MQRVCTSLLVVFLTASLAGAEQDAPPQSAPAPAPATVSATVAGVTVEAAVAENGRDVTLRVGDGQEGVALGLPAGGVVSEIRLTPWLKTGIALAIKTRDPQTDERNYFWSTAWVDGEGGRVSRPNLGHFLKSKIDYDLVGVVNSQSDSIYVTLVRHQRAGEAQTFSGFVYVNNCPVAPGLTGELYPLGTRPPIAAAAPDEPSLTR